MDRDPRTFSDLQRLVRSIRLVEMPDDGTHGEWKAEPAGTDPSTWDYGIVRTPGIVLLAESLRGAEIPAILAHELGHAATTELDRQNRGKFYGEDEWRSELAADWYAYRWGFGREIARHRKRRDQWHHGPPPGSTAEVAYGDRWVKYRITRNFVGRIIAEGEIPEEARHLMK
jgi:hypothetical protein